VLEPHLVGPGGDLPALLYSRQRARVEVLCAQGPAPAGATIQHYRKEGLSLIPGDGLLATVIPGAFGGWMLMLRDYGRLSLRTVLEPALGYAETGHPTLPRVSTTIAELADFFRTEWPTSFATWLPGGAAPRPWARFANPALAATWRRLLAEAKAKSGREAQIEAAREAFYTGFVAEAIDGFMRKTAVMDASGQRHRGVLTGEDLSGWRPAIEAPVTRDYHGWTIAKTGPWGQGPTLLQALAILENFDLAAMAPNGPDFVHTIVEAEKLAFADREAYYGDPNFIDVPLDTLLSSDYGRERSRLIGGSASRELRPGVLPGFEVQVASTVRALAGLGGGAVYEPTMAHLTSRRGDTVHIDVIDANGNMVSAQRRRVAGCNPRRQFPSSASASTRARKCSGSRRDSPVRWDPADVHEPPISPSMALKDGKPQMIFGTPGGDQQEQWQAPFLLRHLHHGLRLQDAIEAPAFHTSHFPASFYPRTSDPASHTIERDIGEPTLAALRTRGHQLAVAEPQTVGRLTAASRDADGILRGAATTRLGQAYAVGR
jgi:gamma-glutamyltranspeptidase / glutathione hydrolase